MMDPLSEVINHMDMKTVSMKLGMDRKKLGPELQFEKGELDNLEMDHNTYGSYEICYQLLTKWKQKHAKNATWKALAIALDNIGRSDLGDALMQAHGYCCRPPALCDEIDGIHNLTAHYGIADRRRSSCKDLDLISNIQIDYISQHIADDWPRLALYLEFDDEVDTIIADLGIKGAAAMNAAMLKRFRQKRGALATVRRVTEALIKIDRMDIAEKIPFENC